MTPACNQSCESIEILTEHVCCKLQNLSRHSLHPAENSEEIPLRAKAVKLIFGALILMFPFLISGPLRAQVAECTVSGTITDASGAAVPNARIAVHNLDTGESTASQTNSAGIYIVSRLTPGEYELSIGADGLATRVVQVTLTGGAMQTVNAAFAATQAAAQSQAPNQRLPNAPSSNRTEPSLGDLGITPEQTQGNAQQQALLDKRTHMLKVHQRLGLITTVPLVATLIASAEAGGRSTSSTGRNVHATLGSAAAGMYFTTAYFAIRAPKISGTETRGPIRLHKALAWIHGPGMILTPILGALAYSQRNNGEKVHGIASAHGPVAIVTAGAYGAAILSVSLKF